jgi:hypothetical protein
MEYHIMNKVEYDPQWAICTECDGQGKVEDGQGQWWLCRFCAGYGSMAARIFGEKNPDKIKPASISADQFDSTKARNNLGGNLATKTAPVEWSAISASAWGGIFYSVEDDRSN